MLSPSPLAELIDSLSKQGPSGVVETASAVIIHTLEAPDAERVRDEVRKLGWALRCVDAGHTPADLDELIDDLGPYRLTIDKPNLHPIRTVLTAEGLKQALSPDRSPESGAWWVANLSRRFDTGALLLCPWGSEVERFRSTNALKSPRAIVRETSERRMVSDDIRPWMMNVAECSKKLWGDMRFQVFAASAAVALTRAVASEVVSSREVAFFGPPRRTLLVDATTITRQLSLDGFIALQNIARWVYDDFSSTEQRHVLLSAEIARSTSAQENIANAFAKAGSDILQGARLAYQFALADLSKDALKAQADLRKSVADDTSKSADGARSIAAGLVTAIATGIGIFVARSVTGSSKGLLSAVALAVAMYLFVVGLSSLRYLAIQRSLRREWRKRFYRFIPNDDYQKMVSEPIGQAEQIYRWIAWTCIWAGEVLLFGSAFLLLEMICSRP